MTYATNPSRRFHGNRSTDEQEQDRIRVRTMNFRTAMCFVLLLFVGQSAAAQQTDVTVRDGRFENPNSIICSLAYLPTIPGDEIWEVSSRDIADISCFSTDQLNCKIFRHGAFCAVNLDDLVARHRASAAAKTVIYVHGNRTDELWSQARGLQVFGALFGSERERQPVRFVIWSWPSDPQLRRVHEYRVNSQRSVEQGRVLASFIEMLGSKSPIGLIGFSFGVQCVIRGAEQLCPAPVSRRLICRSSRSPRHCRSRGFVSTTRLAVSKARPRLWN